MYYLQEECSVYHEGVKRMIFKVKAKVNSAQLMVTAVLLLLKRASSVVNFFW